MAQPPPDRRRRRLPALRPAGRHAARRLDPGRAPAGPWRSRFRGTSSTCRSPGEAGAAYGYFPDLINALYGFGQAHPELFPGGRDPGATALKQTISNLLGIPINYYVLVDLRGFVEVVDAFGGVRLTVTERLDDATSPAFPGEPLTTVDVSPGQVVQFDGREALAYVRTRRQSSDYRRMIRQRCFLTAMADQLDPIQALRHLTKLSQRREAVRDDGRAALAPAGADRASPRRSTRGRASGSASRPRATTPTGRTCSRTATPSGTFC